VCLCGTVGWLSVAHQGVCGDIGLNSAWVGSWEFMGLVCAFVSALTRASLLAPVCLHVCCTPCVALLYPWCGCVGVAWSCVCNCFLMCACIAGCNAVVCTQAWTLGLPRLLYHPFHLP
jgi:hypothetical protein